MNKGISGGEWETQGRGPGFLAHNLLPEANSWEHRRLAKTNRDTQRALGKKGGFKDFVPGSRGRKLIKYKRLKNIFIVALIKYRKQQKTAKNNEKDKKTREDERNRVPHYTRALLSRRPGNPRDPFETWTGKNCNEIRTYWNGMQKFI